MAEKTLNARMSQKHDIEANWLKATNFIPLAGEIIVYDKESDDGINLLEGVGLPEGRLTPYTQVRIKIGDGKTKIIDLPFIQSSDWNQSDKTQSDYIKNRTHYDQMEIVKTDTLVWDGNTENLVHTNDFEGLIFYRVSPLIPPIELFYDEFGNSTAMVGTNWCVLDGAVVIAYEDNTSFDGELEALQLTFPQAGIYFLEAAKLTIPGYEEFENVVHNLKQLDSKYIKDDIARASDVNNTIDTKLKGYLPLRGGELSGDLKAIDHSIFVSETNYEDPENPYEDNVTEINSGYIKTDKIKDQDNNIVLDKNTLNLRSSFDWGDGIPATIKVGEDLVITSEYMTDDISVETLQSIPPSVTGSEDMKQAWKDWLNTADRTQYEADINQLTTRINNITSGGLQRLIVANLPEWHEANESTIYMVGPKEDGTYDEYMYIEASEQFELIGSTDINLSDYVSKKGDTLEGNLDLQHYHIMFQQGSTYAQASLDANELLFESAEEPESYFKISATYVQGTEAAKESWKNWLDIEDSKSVFDGSYALGSMKNKTINDLRSAIKTWLDKNLLITNASAHFYADNQWIDLWNTEEVNTLLNTGSKWTVTVVAPYTTSDYVQLRISTYGDKKVYYTCCRNGKWETVHQVAFNDDLSSIQDNLDKKAEIADIGGSNLPAIG